MREAGCVQSKKVSILGKHNSPLLGRAFQMAHIFGCLRAKFLDRDDVDAPPA
jgi:hypothetical protein